MVAEVLFQRGQDVKQPRLALEPLDQRVDFGPHFAGIVAGEFDEHQRLGLADDEVEIVAIFEAFFGQPQDQAIEQLGGRRMAVENRADRGHGMGHRIEMQHDHAPHVGQRQQVHQRLGNDAQSTFGADQQLGQVEVGAGKHARFALFRFGGQRRRGEATRALGHELVEVVTAHAAQDRRKAGHDLVAILGHDPRHFAMHVADQVAAALRHRQVVGRQRSERGGRGVREHDVERDHAVDRLAVPDRARAGRVVADHAANVSAAAGGHVGAELQAHGRGGGVELVEHDARLDARGHRLRDRCRSRACTC